MAINLKNNKLLENLKKGGQNVKTVVQEGNFKLFLKQGIVLLGIFLLFRYVNGKNMEKTNNYNGQIEAIQTQQGSEQEYLKNKNILLDVEPLFPDISSKNEWLVGQVLEIFKGSKLSPNVSGQQTEDSSNPTYVAARLAVNTNAEFSRFAEFLADIENREEFLKVSGFTLKKDSDSGSLGNNQITLSFNTIFPKEKIGSRMFKDYQEQMEKRYPEMMKEQGAENEEEYD